MKIIERESTNNTAFRMTTRGDAFKYEGTAHMRIYDVDSRNDEGDLVTFNAINLRTGEIISLRDFDEVELLEGARLILY